MAISNMSGKMARENLSGEEIANSPELVHRFFDNPPF